jgi:hypothetical protein
MNAVLRLSRGHESVLGTGGADLSRRAECWLQRGRSRSRRGGRPGGSDGRRRHHGHRRIGVDFDDTGDAGRKRQIFDLSQYRGLSFDFSGTLIPGQKMRVLFPFTSQGSGVNSLGDPPYWAANETDDHSTITVLPGHNIVLWSQVLGPYYLTQQVPPTTPPPFDPSKAYGIGFQVITNAAATTPCAFCVNNLTLLTD